MHYNKPDDPSRPWEADAGLDDLLHGAPLESLEFIGSNVIVDAHDPSAWFDVFHAFPRLEKVYVKYLSSVENFKAFWSGLR